MRSTKTLVCLGLANSFLRDKIWSVLIPETDYLQLLCQDTWYGVTHDTHGSSSQIPSAVLAAEAAKCEVRLVAESIQWFFDHHWTWPEPGENIHKNTPCSDPNHLNGSLHPHYKTHDIPIFLLNPKWWFPNFHRAIPSHHPNFHTICHENFTHHGAPARLPWWPSMAHGRNESQRGSVWCWPFRPFRLEPWRMEDLQG